MSWLSNRRPGFWRNVWLVFHRWAGLIAAPFLLITGLTGAVISWDHELDDLLNPHLTHISSAGVPMQSLDLARRIEAQYPEIRVNFVRLHAEPGESLAFGVQPRLNPSTGKLFESGFNQVFVDPVTGEILGKRQWGAVWPLSTENFVSFLYKLHFSLHFPEIAGSDRWGIWLLGGIAILWALDCFVSAFLTFPAPNRGVNDEGGAFSNERPRSFWQRWTPAWRIRHGVGQYKFNYDLHRAFGLWTWALLFIVAFTGFSLNFKREIFLPVLNAVSKVTLTPFDQRRPQPKNQPIAPQVGFQEVIELAEEAARQRGWEGPAGSVFYAQHFGIYGVQFFSPGADHGAAGAGHKRLYLSGQDGLVLGEKQPWSGTAADMFVQAQFPLHSGRILGVPGRIMISVMGLVVAMLSVTGVYLWWKKRSSRERSKARQVAASVLSTEVQ